MSSAGVEAVELCELAGLVLDPWQRFVLACSLNERADGRWAAFEVGLLVSRQNGKGGIIEGRELTGLFLLGERLIIHSAHLFDTALEAFGRLLTLIEDNPEFDRRVARVSRAHGEEGITLKGGQRIRFRTRTKGGGRGLTGDCVILDEAMDLPDAVQGALLPTVSARPNPQVWYVGTAVDKEVHEHGVVFTRVRQRGHAGADPALAWFEWSAAGSFEDLRRNPAMASDRAAWAQANPALGIRIREEIVANEQRSMKARTFAVERLSAGEWPSTEDREPRVISEEDWLACADSRSRIEGVPVFAIDVTPDHAWGSIGTAGARADGDAHLEIIEHRPQTGWIAERAERLQQRHPKAEFVVDPRGPAASLVPDLAERKLRLVEVSAQDYAGACGLIFDGFSEHTVHYPDPQPELEAAVEGVRTRPVGDAFAWGRKASTVVISPLVAVTLALWGVSQRPPPRDPQIVSLADVLAREAQRAGRS